MGQRNGLATHVRYDTGEPIPPRCADVSWPDFASGMGATLSAAQNVVLQGFDPVAVMATVAEEKITHALLVPAWSDAARSPRYCRS